MLLNVLAPIVMQVMDLLPLLAIFALFWFIIAILLCVWVYRDAESRGMSGVLWLIVMLLIGILGLIVYLIVRKDKSQD